MRLRERVHAAVHRSKAGEYGEMEELVAVEPRAVRYLLGMSYHADPDVRRSAARGIALASRHHPGLVENVMRRLVWAMNDEAATHAVTAPEVLQAVADERPELLLPLVPDLTRLGSDPALQDGLARTLRAVAARCPGKVGVSLSESLNSRCGSRRGSGERGVREHGGR